MKYLEIGFGDISFVLIDVVIVKFIVIGVELGLLHDCGHVLEKFRKFKS